MSYNHYEPELKEKIIRLYLEEGLTKKSLTKEYHLGKGTLDYWLQQRHKELKSNFKIQEDSTTTEIKRLNKELAEVQKENRFLKKTAVFFAKEIN